MPSMYYSMQANVKAPLVQLSPEYISCHTNASGILTSMGIFQCTVFQTVPCFSPGWREANRVKHLAQELNMLAPAGLIPTTFARFRKFSKNNHLYSIISSFVGFAYARVWVSYSLICTTYAFPTRLCQFLSYKLYRLILFYDLKETTKTVIILNAFL